MGSLGAQDCQEFQKKSFDGFPLYGFRQAKTTKQKLMPDRSRNGALAYLFLEAPQEIRIGFRFSQV